MKRAHLDMIEREQELEMKRALDRIQRAEPSRADLARRATLKAKQPLEQSNVSGARFFRSFEKGSLK
ncbi:MULTISPECIES: hypothetical protein [unclassified Mesorhizobium]|uniref:hypothetical protein n=1 Tax=unclassified Mesorhizobium TaxID=325217 RepID=UPI000FCC78F9|nr:MULTISPECIES: hypothetical protein [unclassified Mesorhizobium]RUX97439.1 hypothetical protein EN993_03820 [Mesorhizobium sp. M7D.F.Ca.US.004.01.2.1]RVA36625.1 hypothetical protein EN935_01630 [Mesorhizobium sp. M7D.F.Ca.US.004.03.1.1]